ncbi:MAG: Wzz/FepE/Etk N-terminal domain-containing protein, partial [Halanaerobium sp.]|nr:Wzz/FepE/Etk N-terminal domain-containing protein [Halanaerobium sp.]
MENANEQAYHYKYHEDVYEIDLREYIRVLWNGKWLIFGLFIAAIFVAGAYSFVIAEPVYETQVTIQLTNAGGLYSNPKTVIQVLKSNNLVSEALKKTDKEFSPAELRNFIQNNIEASNIDGTGIINLEVRGTEPAFIQELAKHVVGQFSELSHEQYQEQIQVLESQ